jgi:hypothetical protein
MAYGTFTTSRKFEIGDEVVANAAASDHYAITTKGWRGRVVSYVDSYGERADIKVHGQDGRIYPVNSRFFDHAKSALSEAGKIFYYENIDALKIMNASMAVPKKYELVNPESFYLDPTKPSKPKHVKTKSLKFDSLPGDLKKLAQELLDEKFGDKE